MAQYNVQYKCGSLNAWGCVLGALLQNDAILNSAKLILGQNLVTSARR